MLAEDLYFSGNTVVLDHGLGMFSLLAHLSRIDVTAGQRGGARRRAGAVWRDRPRHRTASALGAALSEFSVDPLSVVAVLSDLKE